MKRIIRNITSAFALVALAASCSNSEIDELNNQPLDLPLSLSAEVSQTVTRAEGAQTVTIGTIESPIAFDLTIAGETKSMQLGVNGAVSYAEGNAPYTVSIKENETLTPNCSVTEIQNVPLTFTRDGASFSFTSSLVGNATQLSISAKKVGANRIIASTVIPMKVNCSGLYIKINQTVKEGSYILYNNVKYPVVGVTDGSACFINIEKTADQISNNEYFAVLQIKDGSVYKVQTTTAIDPSTASLYVMELTLPAQTRTISEQNTIYVAPTIENW